MDMQTIFDNAVAAARAKELETSDQLLLGELIQKLESVKNKGLPVFYDFNDKESPTYFMSWRGSYCEPALGHEENKVTLVSDLLLMAKEEIGKVEVGYKGGDFTMHKRSPIWIANYGTSG